MAAALGALGRRDAVFHARDVGRALRHQRALVGVVIHADQSAAGDAALVQRHEAAGAVHGLVFVHGDQPAGAQHHVGHTVARHGAGDGGVLQRFRVHHALDRLHHGLHLARVDAQRQLRTRAQRLGRQPEQARLEHRGFDRGIGFVAGNFPALDENLTVQGEANGLPGRGALGRRGGIPSLDPSDARGLVARREQQPVADPEPAAFDTAGIDAPSVGFMDLLQRQPQRQVRRGPRRPERVQRIGHRRPAVPRHARRRLGEVVAVARDDGNEGGGLDAEPRETFGAAVADLVEPLFREPDRVHLVDDDRHLLHAQEVQQAAEVARLPARVLLRVDQQQRGVGRRGACDHGAQKLAVARRVDQHAIALRGLEPDLRGGVGGLVALGIGRVHQERPFERRAAPLARRPDRLDPAFRQLPQLVEQPAGQRRLAVAHMAHDHDGELSRGGIGGCGHAGPGAVLAQAAARRVYSRSGAGRQATQGPANAPLPRRAARR